MKIQRMLKNSVERVQTEVRVYLRKMPTSLDKRVALVALTSLAATAVSIAGKYSPISALLITGGTLLLTTFFWSVISSANVKHVHPNPLHPNPFVIGHCDVKQPVLESEENDDAPLFESVQDVKPLAVEPEPEPKLPDGYLPLCIRGDARNSGFINGDGEYQFAKELTTLDGQPIRIDGDNDFYVQISPSSSISAPIANVRLDVPEFLPSSLFKGCKAGDVIAFVYKNKKYHFVLLDNHKYGKPFEVQLEDIRTNIPPGLVRNNKDYIDKLMVGNIIVKGAVKIANGMHAEREVTDLLELRDVPRSSAMSHRRARELDQMTEMRGLNDDGEPYLMFPLPGYTNEDLDCIHYFRSDNVLHIWVDQRPGENPNFKGTVLGQRRTANYYTTTFAKELREPNFQFDGKGFLIVRFDPCEKLPRTE